jgi:hypothetical protein
MGIPSLWRFPTIVRYNFLLASRDLPAKGGFDGLEFDGAGFDWDRLFGDWLAWHGRKNICPIEK